MIAKIDDRQIFVIFIDGKLFQRPTTSNISILSYHFLSISYSHNGLQNDLNIKSIYSMLLLRHKFKIRLHHNASFEMRFKWEKKKINCTAEMTFIFSTKNKNFSSISHNNIEIIRHFIFLLFSYFNAFIYLLNINIYRFFSCCCPCSWRKAIHFASHFSLAFYIEAYIECSSTSIHFELFKICINTKRLVKSNMTQPIRTDVSFAFIFYFILFSHTHSDDFYFVSKQIFTLALTHSARSVPHSNDSR